MLLRTALVAGLIGLSLALLEGKAGVELLGRHGQQVSPAPVEGDLLYRVAMWLNGAPRQWQEQLGIDPEDLIQAAIARYERAGLPTDAVNPAALLRLAIIYARRGHAQESSQLLERLVLIDGDNAKYYFAVSNVYSATAVAKPTLYSGEQALKSRRDWLTRLVLVDLYRRAGGLEQAAAAMGDVERSTDRFMAAFVALGLTYLALFLAGCWSILRFLYLRLFTLPAPAAPRPALLPHWSALDAVEVAAVLLIGVVLAGVCSSLVEVRLREAAPWAVSLLALVSYLLFSAPAVLVLLRRIGISLPDALGLLGLGSRLNGRALTQAATAYGVALACLALGALALDYLGEGLLEPMSTSPIGLVQSARSVPDLLVYFLLICVLAPLVEEIIFRGFVYSGLRGQLSFPLAVVLSAAMFAAAHLNMAPASMVAVAGIGVVLAYLYEHTRSLWPSILFHALHNILSFALILVISR